MRRRRRQKTLSAEMNVVPYIDVMLVLLIIFMITAPLINQAVEIDLPESDQASDVEMPKGIVEDVLPLVLFIDAGGRYYLNWEGRDAQRVDLEEVTLVTASALSVYPKLPVLLQADKQVHYDAVMAGINALKAGGAQQVGLSTAREEE